MAAEFRFNFQLPEEVEENHQNSPTNGKCIAPKQAKLLGIPKHFEFPQDVAIEELKVCGICLEHLSAKDVEKKMKEGKVSGPSDTATAVGRSTDLVPSVYEGGLNLWECTVDLIEFLLETSAEFKDKRVLELGCGAGLPGIFALSKGAKVDFQDYNEEVLKYLTIPNVGLNLTGLNSSDSIKDMIVSKCNFFAGDWGELETFINPTKCQEKCYDVILTAETIYNVDNYHKLYNFFRAHLRKPNGIVFVAAKTYYFGVGGGTRSFEEMVKEKGEFIVSVCKTYEEGVQREILALKWKNGD